jgi:hypothetical protein
MGKYAANSQHFLAGQHVDSPLSKWCIFVNKWPSPHQDIVKILPVP